MSPEMISTLAGLVAIGAAILGGVFGMLHYLEKRLNQHFAGIDRRFEEVIGVSKKSIGVSMSLTGVSTKSTVVSAYSRMGPALWPVNSPRSRSRSPDSKARHRA